ncbi:(2Fe-2S)-binding protein [Ferrovibrio sp.]|uniref:(2Fe-2S)-binding protein n=1 Tax=Ferrovibrio sp. TaxID=1917215 RepID=UPI00311E08D2
MANTPETAATADDMVCVCFGVKRADIVAHLQNPQQSFDTLVDATGIGTKCTACMLDVDLIVNEVSGRHAMVRLQAGGLEQPLPGPVRGFVHPVDFANSAPFINRDGIRTVLRVLNSGMMFADSKEITGYDYRVHLIGDAGRRHAVLDGRLEARETLELDFSEVAGLPGDGWFILDLSPDKLAVVGTTRPQILLIGPDWAASFHPQLQAMACRGRAIPVGVEGGLLRTSVSVINGYRRPAQIEMSLYGVDKPYEKTATAELGGFCSTLLNLDQYFRDVPDGQMYTLVVRSDVPVRKHVVNIQANGAISIDHFPNFK